MARGRFAFGVGGAGVEARLVGRVGIRSGEDVQAQPVVQR